MGVAARRGAVTAEEGGDDRSMRCVAASAAAPALLVLSDAYSDGWQATVDGQDAPIYRANYAFRGVWLAPGDHTIIFTYRPRTFLIGGGVSAITLLLLAGYGVWRWWS